MGSPPGHRPMVVERRSRAEPQGQPTTIGLRAPLKPNPAGHRGAFHRISRNHPSQDRTVRPSLHPELSAGASASGALAAR